MPGYNIAIVLHLSYHNYSHMFLIHEDDLLFTKQHKKDQKGKERRSNKEDNVTILQFTEGPWREFYNIKKALQTIKTECKSKTT